MAVKSGGFAIGNLRAKENRLLKQSDLARFMSAKSTDELSSMLRDSGIGDPASQSTVPEILREDTEKLWSYLYDIAPDMSVFEPFLYENDFHNLKAILKAVVRNTDYSDLLLLPANVDIKYIETAIKEKRFDILPDFMRKSAEEAYETLVKGADPQLADCIIDAGCMTAQYEKAKELKNAAARDVLISTVFYNNIKAALRSARAQKSAAFLEKALTENGVVSKTALKNAALGGEEKVLELLDSSSEMNGQTAAECYRRSPAEFEKFCDNRRIAVAGKCRYVTMGDEPLVGYMLARMAQTKDIRIIYSGIKTGQSSEQISERLRELYD